MIRDACFLAYPEYEPPTHTEVRELIHKHELTQEEYANLVGVKSRAARYWCSTSEKGGRQIPYATWHLSLLLLKEIYYG